MIFLSKLPKIIIVFVKSTFSVKEVDPNDYLRRLDTYLQVVHLIQLIGVDFKMNLLQLNLFSGANAYVFHVKLLCQKTEDVILF